MLMEQRSRAGSWLAAVSILLATIVTGWLFVLFLQASIESAVLGQGSADAGVILNTGVLGYLFGTLLIRVARRRFSLPPPRTLATNLLTGYGRGWLIGLAAVGAKSLLSVLRSGAPPPSGSWIADAIFFVLALLVIAFPGLLALVVANSIRPRSSLRADGPHSQ
jgi:hypothetical protein